MPRKPRARKKPSVMERLEIVRQARGDPYRGDPQKARLARNLQRWHFFFGKEFEEREKRGLRGGTRTRTNPWMMPAEEFHDPVEHVLRLHQGAEGTRDAKITIRRKKHLVTDLLTLIHHNTMPKSLYLSIANYYFRPGSPEMELIQKEVLDTHTPAAKAHKKKK